MLLTLIKKCFRQLPAHAWGLAAVWLFLCSSAYSSDLEARRKKVLQEVLEIIKDEEMAREIVEIRLKREAHKLENDKLSPAKQAVYISVGSRIAVGYAQKIGTNLALRAEVSGLDSAEQSKRVDYTNYRFTEKNLSLGAYLDWFPTESSFRLTGGVNVNRMRTNLTGIGSTVNINGSEVSLGNRRFDVEFKFPTFTPYIGLGFGDKNDAGEGLYFYGDLGLMLGKYDAIASTSLIGSQDIKVSDVDAEINNLRKNLYKWNFIPTATIGLTYRFK